MATKLFEQSLLERGLITPEQLLKTLAHQRAEAQSLGKLARDKELLSDRQLDLIEQRQRISHDRFGDLAISQRFLNIKQLQQLISLQKQGRKDFAEALAELGFLSPERIQEQLQLYRQEQAQIDQHLSQAIKQHGSTYNSNALGGIACSLFKRSLGLEVHLLGICKPEELPYEADSYYLSNIGIESVRDSTVSLACQERFLYGVASRFIKIPESELDLELAWDASGEFLNLICGYYAKDITHDDCSYKIRPPIFNRNIDVLAATYEQVTYLRMESELGSFLMCSSE
ncbi:MAG: hypothetical protein OIF35_07280 [Cellvibrionaceae bacterium]|nr:hypothetical protein [Cellvibrionaceae bacterium]MCV6627766.1 hypothetical protein [Cellvibrionaceae bacterium]